MEQTQVSASTPLDFHPLSTTRHWRPALSFAVLLGVGALWCWACIQAFTPALAIAWAGIFLAAQTIVAWDLDWWLCIGPVARARQVYGDRLLPALMGLALYVAVLVAVVLHVA
jgi:hypothetical protein